MNSKKVNKAFSLIELSIVILIIGILVAGVTQSSRLIKRMKLVTAQNMTRNSAVPSIKDLLVWIEPSLDESFISSQTDQDSQVTQWNDINPTTSTKYFFVKNASSQVVYEQNGINGLPSIKFLGDTSQEYIGNGLGAFVLSRSSLISDKLPLPTPLARMTIFLVTKNNVLSGPTRYAFYNGKANTSTLGGIQDGWGYGLSYGNTKKYILFGAVVVWYSNASVITTNNEITTIQYAGIGSNSINFYVNGIQESFPTTGASPNQPTTHFVLGNGNGYEMWNGLISEVIIYERILNTEERKAVESYLGAKYAIKVS